VTAKTTSLKKTIVGLTPIRESDIQSKAMTDLAPKLGGLVEFYRSPARVAWTPTGTNVPDYPKLAQLWWKNVAVAVTGEKTPQAAMDNLAEEMDQVMAGWNARAWRAARPSSTRRKTQRQVADRQGCSVGQAGQREAQGRDHRLRHAAQCLEGGQGALTPPAWPT
jgi:glycerol transport system substrate-binding protein